MRSLRVGSFKPAALGLLAFFALAVSACSAGTAVPAPADDEGLVLGQAVYTNNCASCHRADGAGRRGAALDGDAMLEAYPNPADQRAMIVAGRGTMPGFDGRLTDEQLDAVVRYTREVLGNAATDQ